VGVLTAQDPAGGRRLRGIVTRVDVRLLGPLQILDTNGAELELPGARLKALVALLALEAPQLLTADVLLTSLWPESETPSKSALHAAISRVRSVLGDESIETTPAGYRLGVPASNTDIDRFRRHTRRGRQLATLGNHAAAGEAFRYALSQWRGELLADLFGYDFVDRAQTRLDEERLQVVEWLMDAELAAGNHDLIVGELSGLVEAFPLRERLWGSLMLALYRGGRQAEALRTYQRFATLIGEEAGLEPSPDLVDLEQRILLHDPALADIRDGTEFGSPAGTPELLSFEAGEMIVDEGQGSGTVYWVEEGTVAVVKSTSEGDELTLAELGAGRYFGELASLLGTGRTAAVRAVTPVTVSLHSVEGFRARLGAERAKDALPRVPTEEIRALESEGNYLAAFDAAMSNINRGGSDPELRYLAVRALSNSGAIVQARRRYETLGLHKIDPGAVSDRLADDIAALAARLDKEMALRRSGEERQEWARRSADGYRRAFERQGSPYTASNAATMYLLAGDTDLAERLAQEALDGLRDPTTLHGEDRYWEAATEAEAALTLGDEARAIEALAHAAGVSVGNHSVRARTRGQLRYVCEAKGVDASILDAIANPTVVHYCGHRILPPGVDGRFPAAEEERVAEEFRQVFERLGVGFGYGSLAAGADILAAEALLERGARLSVQLPFERDEFVRASVATAGKDWVKRFERCIAEADTVETVTRTEYLDDPILFDFCARIAMGKALIRASYLEAPVHQVAVWDGRRTGAAAGTSVDVETWRMAGLDGTVIDVEADEGKAMGKEEGLRAIRGILFADFAAFSTLDDAQVLRFQERVMTEVAHALEPFRTSILLSRTWGDGIHLIFTDVTSAATCALELQEAVARIDFDALGLGTLRGLRIAAHASPVFDGWDPVAGDRLYFGSGLTTAARIEPGTPEGEVYTTRAFAALAMLTPDRTFETQYVGTQPTAKNYGEMPLYALRRTV
jgi:DNA-binding SARP family transcriptional activator